MPKPIGLVDGKLHPVPTTPNCVCTQAPESDRQHRMEPWSFSVAADAVMAALVKALESQPRTTIVTREPRYLHAISKSKLIGFADDVEFLIDESARKVHFRSASRVGYGDWGVNRKRMQALGEAVRTALGG
jgi:uncharacterized protein (DUF1499 family)